MGAGYATLFPFMMHVVDIVTYFDRAILNSGSGCFLFPLMISESDILVVALACQERDGVER
jgi:hypothetical protein